MDLAVHRAALAHRLKANETRRFLSLTCETWAWCVQDLRFERAILRTYAEILSVVEASSL